MERHEVTRALKARALELGFAKVGVVEAVRLDNEGSRLRQWLDRGFQGSMAWMERTAEKRIDPRLHMPSVRSIVAVADNYYTPHRHDPRPGAPRISRYAWGDDYHDVVGERLRALKQWLEAAVPGIAVKIAVDTSPVMDKVWAERAGLGWIGKHTNLITTDYGSWVFLGALLVDVALDYDVEPVEDRCGTCTACIDACPTAAIVEPYVVDSNLCISYVTIELRDAELPVATDGWVYGCDVCQDVCPWNRFEQPTTNASYQPRTGLVAPDLDELIHMTPERFSERFRNSAIKRTKLVGLVRNARAAGAVRIDDKASDRDK